MAGRKEELSAMKFVLMATSTMDQAEPSASSATKTIDLSEVSAGKAGDPTSHVIHITEVLASNNVARELLDRELFATKNQLNVSLLLLESLGSIALGMSLTTVEPCALKMQQLARLRLKNKLAQFLDSSTLPFLRISLDQLIVRLTLSPTLLFLSAKESKTKTD